MRGERMSVLVTGGGGYIGSHMVCELVDRGERVVVLDDLSTGFDWAVRAEAELVIGDVGDRVLLDRLIKRRRIETVMHFAGSVVVPDSVADPLGYYLNNTVKSRELIAAAVANGVKKFVFSSTSAVYGVPATMPVTGSVRCRVNKRLRQICTPGTGMKRIEPPWLAAVLHHEDPDLAE